MAVGGKVALMVLFCLMVATAPPYTAEGAMTCQMVVSSLTPCASYLTRGGPVPASCCSGMTSLYKAATTTADRRMACRCMEQAAGMDVDTVANKDADNPILVSPASLLLAYGCYGSSHFVCPLSLVVLGACFYRLQ
ncbi:Bifunctional inhibitor/plant lipid transfer protein/seed storage helical domain-containing protein [Cynara cardunculus var. scolymus]|uniref:Non-specific lipid-transfer protein n=1 Tax=Cynara cardunculus var. scolymus TaxID=59895 RepID=A0A103Y644_CYNCS|nr:Bifunctional inhibitor/plant lipid transfer protein/seed storage helical domain-containing protein [Cynara cardunculus var. scolymus]